MIFMMSLGAADTVSTVDDEMVEDLASERDFILSTNIPLTESMDVT